jgi:hypothetical protein
MTFDPDLMGDWFGAHAHSIAINQVGCHPSKGRLGG